MLRLQLGDVLLPSFSPTGGITFRTNHSPILGWAFDGHPIYGPYGYSDPMNPSSGIRRMRSGYVLRNGENGTTDLSEKDGKTGRTSLPLWRRLLSGITELSESEYGPLSGRTDTNTTCNYIEWGLGRYVEDYSYLGHLFKDSSPLSLHRLGEDFDLDIHNGRCCKTPEFPDGTYAYFVTFDEDGEPAFPYITGWQFCGKMDGLELPGGTPTGATLYFSAQHFVATGHAEPSGSPERFLFRLEWSSREGGEYRVLVSDNLQNWTEVSPLLPSGGMTTSYTYDPGPNPPAKQFFKVTLERDGGAQP